MRSGADLRHRSNAATAAVATVFLALSSSNAHAQTIHAAWIGEWLDLDAQKALDAYDAAMRNEDQTEESRALAAGRMLEIAALLDDERPRVEAAKATLEALIPELIDRRRVGGRVFRELTQYRPGRLRESMRQGITREDERGRRLLAPNALTRDLAPELEDRLSPERRKERVRDLAAQLRALRGDPARRTERIELQRRLDRLQGRSSFASRKRYAQVLIGYKLDGREDDAALFRRLHLDPGGPSRGFGRGRPRNPAGLVSRIRLNLEREISRSETDRERDLLTRLRARIEKLQRDGRETEIVDFVGDLDIYAYLLMRGSRNR